MKSLADFFFVHMFLAQALSESSKLFRFFVPEVFDFFYSIRYCSKVSFAIVRETYYCRLRSPGSYAHASFCDNGFLSTSDGSYIPRLLYNFEEDSLGFCFFGSTSCYFLSSSSKIKSLISKSFRDSIAFS